MTKERPILMSTPMVRAILEGRKTQTRRVVNPQSMFDGREAIVKRFPNQTGSPYGAVGDGMWCRETWRECGSIQNCDDSIPSDGFLCSPDRCRYKADAEWDGPWRPSIFMPRWACRLTLEVTAVRVERLQDITEDDARAEGIRQNGDDPATATYDLPEWGYHYLTARNAFLSLWDSINADRKDAKTGERLPYAWRDNPWVWCISFRRTDR